MRKEMLGNFAKEENKNTDIKKTNSGQEGKGMLRISISEKCIKCGACLECKAFVEQMNGTIEVQGTGIFNEEDINNVFDMKEMCPVQAILVERLENPIFSKNEVIKKLQELEKYTYPVPTYDVVSIDECKTSFEFSASLHSSYEYSSDSSAERAGLSELKRGVIDRLDSIGTHILHDYQEQILQRILTYKKQEDNYTYQQNKKVSALLQELRISAEAMAGRKFKLPADFEVIDVSPNFGRQEEKNNIVYWIVSHLSETSLIKHMADNVEAADWYDCYVNTDSMDVYAGTDRHGYTKTKEKYAYNLSEAVMKVKEHYFYGADSAVKEFVSDFLKKDDFRKIYLPIEIAVREKAKRLLAELGEK